MLGIIFAGRNQLRELWVDSKVLRLADKLKRKCEKKWSRQRLQRMVAKKKRERGELPPQRQQVERQGRGGSNTGRGGPGRGRGGPGRGGQQPGRGRNQQSQGRGRGGGQGRGRGTGKSQKRAGRGTSNPDRADPGSNEAQAQPAKGDVWFGNESHPGTKSFQRAVQKAYKAFPEDDFGPEIYKHVKKQLKGKRFFIDDGSGSCTEVSRVVIKNEMEKQFNSAKAAN